MPKLINLNTVKIVWGDNEIIGDKRTALFDVPRDATIEIPDPTHIKYEKEPTVWGSRTRGIIQDDDRAFSVPVVANDADASIAIMDALYKKQVDISLKIVSIVPDSMGYVFAEYDTAMLAISPNLSTIEDGYPTLNIDFTVGVKANDPDA